MRVLRTAHRWLGLLLALPLLVQGLSGAILTLEPALSGVGERPAVQIGSANAALASALDAAPPGMRAVRYHPPASAGEPARVVLLPAGQARGAGLVVRVDPATGAALGPAQVEAGALAWIKRLHENWLIPQWGGRQFAGWLGVGLVALVLFGLPLWWPGPGGWRAAFSVPRRARGARLQRALHGAMGGWLALLLLVTGLTGVTQGFPQTTRAVLGAGPAQRPPAGGRNAAAPNARPDLDAAIALAKAAAPTLALRLAILPAGAEPIRLFLGPPGTIGAATATTALVDTARARVVSLQTPESLPGPERLARWLRDVHAGDGLGPVWRGFAALTGLALPMFGITGTLLWWLKRRNRARGRAMAGQVVRSTPG